MREHRRLGLPPALLVLFLVFPAVAGEPDTAGPVGAAPEPPAAAVLAAIPFEPGPATRILLNLAPIGHRPFVMMLDTGAADSVITPLRARELGVSVRKNKSSPYRQGTRLGRDLQFWVDTRSSDTGSKTGWEYGLLGGTFLVEYVLEIDYPGRVVRFLDPKKYEVPEKVDAPNEVVVPIRAGTTRIGVSIDLDGEKTDALLDTGAPTALILSGKTAKKLGIDVESLPKFMEVGAVMGPIQTRLYETDRFRFGGFDFEPTPVLVSPRGWYNQAGPTGSVIGYDVLRQFVIRIDYDRQRMWLRRSGDTHMTFFGAAYSDVQALLAATSETTADGVPSEAEAQRLREDAARRDRESRERFEKKKESALYVEESGGWSLVDGPRLRRGASEGEKWVTFEEMQLIKRERAEAQAP